MPTIDNEKKEEELIVIIYHRDEQSVCVLWQTVAFVVVLPVAFF